MCRTATVESDMVSPWQRSGDMSGKKKGTDSAVAAGAGGIDSGGGADVVVSEGVESKHPEIEVARDTTEPVEILVRATRYQEGGFTHEICQCGGKQWRCEVGR